MFKNFWYPRYEQGHTYIIAEAGINAFGNIDCAKRLIDVAATCGCNAIKFQKRTPELAVPEDQKNKIKSTPDGDMTYLEYKQLTEFSIENYKELFNYSKTRNIDLAVSVWDCNAFFEMTYNFSDIPWLKIPSALITNVPLLKLVSDWAYDNNKKIILSRGMTTEEELDLTMTEVKLSLKEKFRDLCVLMHCNSAYPCQVYELNLNCIQTLKEKYDLKYVGWSNHATRILPTIASIYKGANYIEVHINLSRDMYGSDSQSSLEPAGLFNLTSGVRMLEEAEGDGKIKVFDSELPFKEKLRG